MQGLSGGLTNLIILQIHHVLRELSVTFTSHCSLKTGTTDPCNECQRLRNRTPHYCGTAAVRQKSTLVKYPHHDMRWEVVKPQAAFPVRDCYQ